MTACGMRGSTPTVSDPLASMRGTVEFYDFERYNSAATLQDNILFFYSPTDVAEHPEKVPVGRTFRIGGLVQQGSVKRDTGLEVHFVVTDGKSSVPVSYSGVLPDLFREGQGVVASGTRGNDGTGFCRINPVCAGLGRECGNIDGIVRFG